MNKSTIIIGKQNTGKTTQAMKIASQYQKDEFIIIPYRGPKTFEDKFLFSECTPKTKLIIFEELWDVKQIEQFFYIVNNEIVVNKKTEKLFIIKPTFVLTIQADIENLKKISSSVYQYFNIINTINH